MPSRDNLRFGLSSIESHILAFGNPPGALKDQRTEQPYEPLDLVASVMPGLRIEDWETETGQEGMKTEAVKRAIVAHLSALPEGTDKVSLAALKKALKDELPPKLGSSGWQAARDRACAAVGWKVRGRTLVRI